MSELTPEQPQDIDTGAPETINRESKPVELVAHTGALAWARQMDLPYEMLLSLYLTQEKNAQSLASRIERLESENRDLREKVNDVKARCSLLQERARTYKSAKSKSAKCMIFGTIVLAGGGIPDDWGVKVCVYLIGAGLILGAYFLLPDWEAR